MKVGDVEAMSDVMSAVVVKKLERHANSLGIICVAIDDKEIAKALFLKVVALAYEIAVPLAKTLGLPDDAIHTRASEQESIDFFDKMWDDKEKDLAKAKELVSSAFSGAKGGKIH